MKNDKGLSAIAIIISIAIIVVIVGAIIYFVTNKVEDVTKMDEEYSKTEITEALEKLINNKVVDASKQIQGTKDDISTSFNENNMISYLDNAKDLPENAGVDCIDPYEKSEKIQNATEDGEVYTVYIIKPEALSDKVVNFGKGNFEDGDVFTLEPITQNKEDGTKKSTGSYEIKYYDNNKEVAVVEKVDLYLTNQS